MPRFPWLIILPLLLAAGCAPMPPAAGFETPTPEVAPTGTPTIEWFPPTRTPTVYRSPTPQPTENRRPAVGDLVYQDDFRRPGRWQVGQLGGGTIAYDPDALVLAVSAPRGSLATQNTDLILEDFYLEITTSPSLCRNGDAYGLLLRARDPLNAYRLLVACNSMLRLERLTAGQVVTLVDWTPSGQVPPGSPLVLRLGVWVSATEIRVFINDIYQFSAADRVFASGGLGLFARAEGSTPLTVTFSDLQVYAVDRSRVPPSPTPTPTPTRTPVQ